VKSALSRCRNVDRIRIMFLSFFVFEFVLLFLLARILISSMSRLFFRITRSERITVLLLSCLFLPGTIIHELAHLLVAGLLFVKTGDMNLTPKIMDGGVRLGSVEIEKTDILRRAIIGVAPVLVGFVVISGTLIYMLQSGKAINLAIIIVSVIIIFEVSNTLFSSKKDLEGTLEFLFASLVITIGLLIIKPEYFPFVVNFFQRKEISTFFQKADLFLMVPILIDAGFIFVAKTLFRGKV
jgi:hypothetical protein